MQWYKISSTRDSGEKKYQSKELYTDHGRYGGGFKILWWREMHWYSSTRHSVRRVRSSTSAPKYEGKKWFVQWKWV